MIAYDVLIIGGGQAGIPLAWELAKAGKRVALAEHKDLGGSCINFGCTPTKAAIASARVAHLARRASDFGLKIPTVEVDFAAVIERAQGVALESRHSLDKGFAGSENPILLRAHASLKTRSRNGFVVAVGEEEVEASDVVLNTGTHSMIPPITGLERKPYLTSENWLERTTLPEKLAMIGGGYIGLEMGQFYRRMGSRVSVWQTSDRVIEHEDETVSKALQGFLEAEGIEFHLNAKIENVEQLGGSDIFVAVGRQPNSNDLGLQALGVECDAHGFVKVDRRLRTNVEGIWAAGDLRGGPLFTHTSWDDYRILSSQIVGDRSRTTDRIVPYAVFTDPELGRVGLTERECRKQGLNFKLNHFDMNRNGKARELGESGGFIQVLLEQGTDRILGAAVLSVDAAELVHMYVDVMNAKAPAATIRNAVHIHPTLAEAVQSAVK